MSYKNKYLKYKNKYLELKYQKELVKMVGGRICSNDNEVQLLEDDIESLVNYIKTESKCVNRSSTNKKYMIILYGPPASGKTNAFTQCCKLIKDTFDETINHEDIENTFINTGVDDLVYRFKPCEPKQPCQTEDTKTRLINKLAEHIKAELLKQNIDVAGKSPSEILALPEAKPIAAAKNDVLEESLFDIYKQSRDVVDPLSSLLVWLAVYMGKNIIFEIASGNFKYINVLIRMVSWSHIPIIIYPYVNDVSILYDRNVNRSLSEGRKVACHILQSRIQINIDSFNKAINEFEEEYKDIKNIILCSYDNSTRDPKACPEYNNKIVKFNNDIKERTTSVLGGMTGACPAVVQ